MSTKNRITVNLEDDEYQALVKMAGEADRSLAWMGRLAICQLLQRDGDQLSEGAQRPARVSQSERTAP